MAQRTFVVTAFAAVSVGSAIYHYNVKNENPHSRIVSSLSKFVAASAATPEFHRQSSSRLWNENWDFRDPKFSQDESRSSIEKGSPEYAEAIKKRTPTASRNIILVRHGQYIYGNTAEEKCLTKLGHEQAHLTGERLKEFGIEFDKVVYSTMVRAKETAEDILTHLPLVTETMACDMLREGVPIAPEPPVPHYNPSKKEQFIDSARIEAAFRKYFHRASPEQKKDSNELLICHGNVIRYFVCRALQFPPDGWLRLSIDHGSITTITIRPSGRVFVRSFGCVGHMPPEKITDF